MLRFEGLTKRFGATAALDQVSLAVGPGIKVVVGLNGSGKSTLLKVAAGLVRPDSGTVRLAERDITGLAPEERRVGYVPQRPALFRHLNVRENIHYGRRNGRGGEPAAARAIELLGLAEVLERRPEALSGGYQSRVSLARALAAEPGCMLLDEPLSDQDVIVKETLLLRFREVLVDLGAPVLYVTHDPLEAELLGESFAAMIRGRTYPAGSAGEAFALIKASLF
jgi:molybdate transport system ATP-binding protein